MNTQGGKSENIIIELSDSHNARVFKTANLIHRSEYKLVEGWINERIEKVGEGGSERKDSCKKFSIERLHDTITILGSRGSGKTSFLYSILNSFDEKNEVEVLEIIDPTLIEDKGHVFLMIISLINSKVDKKLKDSDKNPECVAFHKRKSWEERLKSVAAGIPSMDGVGQGYEGWKDPEIIMFKGLTDVGAAKSLEADFQSLVECALSILDKKVFIIAFDDIDINFQRGWPVLETIRKYLTSPHIITLLSGDLRLFSKAIRKRQWENFGKGLLINEGDKLDGISDYNDLVTEMEGQYLLKVLRTQRRVNLTTLLEKKNLLGKGKLNILIDDKKIEDRYDEILREFGINNPYQAESYRSFLLSLPIRTQIQFLSEFENLDNERLKSVDFISPFISDLYEKRINVDLAKSNSTYLIPAILQLLISAKSLNEGYQLQPTTMDTSLNSSLMTLSFLFSANTIDNPYLVFDYMIRIGYVRNLLSSLGYRDENNNKNEGIQPSIEGLCNHVSIFEDKVLKDIVSYIVAYMHANNISKGYKNKNINGLLQLPGLKKKRKDGVEEVTWRIDDVLKDTSPIVRTVAYIPLTISENIRGQSVPIYSIYVLLASIGELIRKIEHDDLSNGLLELSQVRSYPMPSFVGMTIGDDSEMEMLGDDIATEEDQELQVLINQIKDWAAKYKEKKISVSPHLLGKISTRFYYSLGNIEKSSAAGNNLGQEMHRRIISLMNAILVEDVKENMRDLNDTRINLNLNNPSTSSNIFINNLNATTKITHVKRSENKEKGEETEEKNELDLFPFSKWMLSCPLLLMFLNKTDKDQNNNLYTALIKYIGENKLLNDNNINEVLSKVILSSNKPNSDKLDYFYHSIENIDKTIEHLKQNQDKISYHSFMNDDYDKLEPILTTLFKSRVTEKNVKSARKNILKKRSTW